MKPRFFYSATAESMDYGVANFLGMLIGLMPIPLPRQLAPCTPGSQPSQNVMINSVDYGNLGNSLDTVHSL